jgi:threonyl-tRNA synthetase
MAKMEHKIKLTFPDKTHKEFDKGITGEEIARSISEGLLRKAICLKLDDSLIDLTTTITKSGEIRIITFSDIEGKNVFRHSTAHLMAQAITRLFPEAKLTIGPVVEEGFYYDIDHAPFKQEDLEKIEEEMKKIVKEDLKIERKDISIKEALDMFKDNLYKQEIIKNIDSFAGETSEKSDSVSIYTQGDFFDLCRGPHLPRTGMIKAFKLTKLAGAYWRGDAKNKQLQRIYGISFSEKKELDEYLKLLEEAEKRDHKKIGKELELFSFHDEGPGFPFFKPKGMIIWNALLDYWREVHRKYNYKEIKTPIMLSKVLWERSGHWGYYRANMYTSNIDGMDYAIKPMNCPGGMMEFAEKTHSYRDLPLRVGEIGLVHRHELSGVLNGLFRVRCFHQDDAHIFMTEDQMQDEILGVLKLAEEMYATFGLSYHLELSTRPEKSVGTDEAWELSTNGLKSSLDSTGKTYKINEGDGAFYGPKIDIHIKDALGRTWQCGTIQLDMNLPERFDLTYEGADGKKHRPIMLHRVIYGSLERFFGILTEHYAGKFPLWLSPVQVRILTIADRHNAYADKVYEVLNDAGIRAEKDYRAETMSKKVRNAQLDQVNYIVVIGDKEAESGTVNVRTRDNVVRGEKDLDLFTNELLDEIKSKK